MRACVRCDSCIAVVREEDSKCRLSVCLTDWCDVLDLESFDTAFSSLIHTCSGPHLHASRECLLIEFQRASSDSTTTAT